MAIVTEKTITLTDGSTHHADPDVRIAVQKAEMAKLSGVKVDPNAGRIGGLPLTSRPGNVPQPVEKAAPIVAPAAAPTVAGLPLRAAASVVNPAPAGGRVGDPRHQQAMSATIAAKIDPESERIINERYAALTPEQREKSQAAHFNDLVRLREGQRIVNGKWETPQPRAADGTFTPSDHVETIPEREGRIAPIREELAALISSIENGNGTPAERAAWSAQLPALTAKLKAAQALGQPTATSPASAPTDTAFLVSKVPADLMHGYRLPAGITTISASELNMLASAKAAGFTQAQVDAFIKANSK